MSRIGVYKAVEAHFPAMGVDTVARLDGAKAKALYDAGMRFVARYLGTLDATELVAITGAGLAVIAVTYSRASGWTPSEALGTSDGKTAVARAAAVRLPVGATLFLDLEGCVGPAPVTTAWANAWATVVQAAGYGAGLYVGAAPGGLDDNGLYALKVNRYWRSGSRVPEPKCGYCMLQLYPFNTTIGGVQVDIDVIQQDRHNRLPCWTVEA